MGIKLITLSIPALEENLGICFRRENKIQSLLWLKIAGRIVWCSISIIQLPNPGVFSHAHYSSQHAPTIHRQNNLHTISIGGATIYRQDYYCINNKGLPWCSFCVSHAGLFALCCSSWQLQRCSPVHKVGTTRKRRRMVRAGRPCCECVWNGGNFIFRLFGDSFNWNREIFLFSLDAFYVRKCFNRITEEESQLFLPPSAPQCTGGKEAVNSSIRSDRHSEFPPTKRTEHQVPSGVFYPLHSWRVEDGWIKRTGCS